MFSTAAWSTRDNDNHNDPHNDNHDANENENDNNNDKCIDNGKDDDNYTDNDNYNLISGSSSGSTRRPWRAFAPLSSLRPPSACSEGRTGSLTSPPPITQPTVSLVAHGATGSVLGGDEVSELIVPSIHPVRGLSEDGGVNVCDCHLVDPR